MRIELMSNEQWKDKNWHLSPESNGNFSLDAATLAVLMDIRSELKKLNFLLHCPNFRCLPQKIDAIRLNTAKKQKRKTSKKS
jgi:hypothetical protein